MLRSTLSLRKVVDATSKEGKEYMLGHMKYTRRQNQFFYTVLFLPLLYLPYHLHYNEGLLWEKYQDPYAIPAGKEALVKETLREKRAREAAEAEARRANGGGDGQSSDPSSSSSSLSSSTTEGSAPKIGPKASHAGGASIWLRGGSFKESLDVRPTITKEKEAEKEMAKEAAGGGGGSSAHSKWW